jgi:hypothetical protein
MTCSPFQDFKSDALPSRINILARAPQKCKAQKAQGELGSETQLNAVVLRACEFFRA